MIYLRYESNYRDGWRISDLELPKESNWQTRDTNTGDRYSIITSCTLITMNNMETGTKMLQPHLAPQTWLEMQAEKNDDKMSGLRLAPPTG